MKCSRGHETTATVSELHLARNISPTARLVAEETAHGQAAAVAGWTCPEEVDGKICGAPASGVPRITVTTSD